VIGRLGVPLSANIMSPLDLLVIVIIALLFFGPGKLAGLGKGLGEGIRNFKSSFSGEAKPDDPEKK
jgi:sec-independent protein translocase protein TatA